MSDPVTTQGAERSPFVPVLVFALAQLVAAALLFLVQPLVGKLLLPFLGGTPAVWNTCLVFFQALLLAGYVYAHLLSRWLSPRRQALVHGALLVAVLLPLFLLRFDVAALATTWLEPPTDRNPIPWLLAVLLITTGLPFFVVATTSPLLQKWFSGTDHPLARDPYFLYGASNLGSLVALLGYPTLLEPVLGTRAQAWAWAVAYLVLLALLVGCSALAVRRASAPACPAEGASEDACPTFWRKLRWVALAFVPSSMMLGATTHITTDIAPIPLLWALPLTLYLLSFILVFSRLPGWLLVGAALLLPVALIGWFSASSGAGDFQDALLASTSLRFYQLLLLAAAVLFALVFARSPERLHLGMVLLLPFVVLAVTAEGNVASFLGLRPFERILLHLGALFVVAMVCHGELALTRPAPRHLTEFYVLLSLGGVLGGAFNALAAPLLFDRVLEYPLIAVVPCLLLPRLAEALPRFRGSALLRPALAVLLVGVGVAQAGALLAANFVDQEAASAWATERFAPGRTREAALWLAEWGGRGDQGHVYENGEAVGTYRTLVRRRNFFGTFTVEEMTDYRTWACYHTMYHGTTNHGAQRMDRPWEPLTYFHPRGAIGQVFDSVKRKNGALVAASPGASRRPGRPLRVAILGVGTGTLAAYAEKDWEVTLYEIDPAVVEVARDADLFSYLADAEARGARVEVVLGDGRQQVRKAPDGHFDLLFMDAFASDSVPVHLITREAVELYFQKLAPGGLLVVNIANRYLSFRPVLGDLAHSLDLVAYAQLGASDPANYKFGSHWVVLARPADDLGDLTAKKDGSHGWVRLSPSGAGAPWTDDYSNLLSVFTW
jgi:hypothetical protein